MRPRIKADDLEASRQARSSLYFLLDRNTIPIHTHAVHLDVQSNVM